MILAPYPVKHVHLQCGVGNGKIQAKNVRWLILWMKVNETDKGETAKQVYKNG